MEERSLADFGIGNLEEEFRGVCVCVGGRKNLSFSSALVMASGRAALLTRREKRRRQKGWSAIVGAGDGLNPAIAAPSQKLMLAFDRCSFAVFSLSPSLSPSRALICSAAFQPACLPCFPIQSSSPPGAALATGRSTSF